MIRPGVVLIAFALCGSAADYQRTVPPGSAIYIDSGPGFAGFLQAAFQDRHVPLQIVSSADKADYVLHLDRAQSTVDVEVEPEREAHFAIAEEYVWMSSRSGNVVWRYAFAKKDMKRGSRAVAEALAEHIKGVVAKGPKP